jgi:hypothetical protein
MYYSSLKYNTKYTGINFVTYEPEQSVMPQKKWTNASPKLSKKRKRVSPNAVADFLSPGTVTKCIHSLDTPNNFITSPQTPVIDASLVILVESDLAGSLDESRTEENSGGTEIDLTNEREPLECMTQGCDFDCDIGNSIKRRLVYDNDDSIRIEILAAKPVSRHEVARQSLLRRNERDGLVMYGINGKGLSFRGKKHNTPKTLSKDIEIEEMENTRSISQCNDDINYDD